MLPSCRSLLTSFPRDTAADPKIVRIHEELTDVHRVRNRTRDGMNFIDATCGGYVCAYHAPENRRRSAAVKGVAGPFPLVYVPAGGVGSRFNKTYAEWKTGTYGHGRAWVIDSAACMDPSRPSPSHSTLTKSWHSGRAVLRLPALRTQQSHVAAGCLGPRGAVPGFPHRARPHGQPSHVDHTPSGGVPRRRCHALRCHVRCVRPARSRGSGSG